MKAVDISGLVKGCLVVIGIAMATGHYGDLQRWARRQAAEALVWKRPLPYFFAPLKQPSRRRAQKAPNHADFDKYIQ